MTSDKKSQVGGRKLMKINSTMETLVRKIDEI